MTKTSRHSYSETISQLLNAISNAGTKIFATIDQTAAATDVGLTLRPTTLIIFGNPKGGTPFMDACPILALDLPLKLLVWEENGTVKVAYVPMSEIVSRYGVTGMDKPAGVIDEALDKLTGLVA